MVKDLNQFCNSYKILYSRKSEMLRALGREDLLHVQHLKRFRVCEKHFCPTAWTSSGRLTVNAARLVIPPYYCSGADYESEIEVSFPIFTGHQY